MRKVMAPTLWLTEFDLSRYRAFTIASSPPKDSILIPYTHLYREDAEVVRRHVFYNRVLYIIHITD